MPTPLKEYIYLIGSRKFGWFKIGKSIRIDIRLNEIGVLLPFKIEVFGIWETYDCTRLEQFLHSQFSDNHVNGEWYAFDLFKVGEVLKGFYPWGAKLIVKDGDEGCPRAAFTNIEKDLITSKLGPFKELRSKLAQRAVAEWLYKNELENNKENRRRASEETHQSVKEMYEKIINQTDLKAANEICANILSVAQELQTLRRTEA